MPSKDVTFLGALGDSLSGRLDWPEGDIKGWVLFAHGFSIGKDLKPARTISKTLVEQGYGMMRFDFTGLGDSGGDFSETNFTSNCEDLRLAARYLKNTYEPPKILIGHSFGGTASLKLADELPNCKAVATIGAPFNTQHVLQQFAGCVDQIERDGQAEVMLAGRPFIIKEQFIADVGQQDMAKEIATLNRALMIFHSPQDQVVGIDNAAEIYNAAKHPKSFVSLDGADHLLLKNPEDAVYVARVLTSWAIRYIH